MEREKNYHVQPVGRLIGIRYKAAGIYGYSFWQGKTEVISINIPVRPDPEVEIDGLGKKLRHRHYDREMTLYPGVRRDVIDDRGLVEGCFQSIDLDDFWIITGPNRLNVHVRKDRWEIYQKSGLAAEMVILDESERVRFTEKGIDMEKRFLVHIFQEIDESLYPFILSIPVLGF